MDGRRQEVTLLWFVENFSFYRRGKGELLFSPAFEPDELPGTVWGLWLYPSGDKDAEKGFISLYLWRLKLGDGPEIISIKFELSILAEDGSALSSKEFEHSFRKGSRLRSKDFMKMDEMLYRRYFPRDFLTVRCRMWRGEGEVERVAPVCARTVIGVETISYLHQVDNFSKLLPNQKNTIQIPSPLKKDCFIRSSLYFNNDLCSDGEMTVEITPSDDGYVLCKRRISLLGGLNRILCPETDTRFDDERKDIRNLPLPFTKQKILSKENEYRPGEKLYLPGDTLTLLCECSFSTGDEFNQREEVEYEFPIALAQGTHNPDLSNVCSASRKASAYPSAMEDIKALYDNQVHTDVELKTETKSFPAHKLVLCARSPVFGRMLSTDMRESNAACVEVDDLEDDVVRRLLLFLYSDAVDALEWGLATRLYYAADKYEVGRLREVCSSFLLEHLTPNNAGELLLLADTHSDADLRRGVEGFILEHEEEVFGSDEWEIFLKKNPVLAGEIMYLKYKRKRNQANK